MKALAGNPAALQSGERFQGQGGSSELGLASAGKPPTPPAWLVGDTRPLEISRALRELVLLALVIVLAVLLHGDAL